VAGALLQATSARVTVGLFAAWLAAIAVGTTASRSIRAAPSLAELASD